MKIDKTKLSKLTKEQKIELIEAMKEKKRRQIAARPIFKPNAGQLPVIMSEAQKRIVISGNGCWAPGTRVRMFNGDTKAVEEVCIGDELMGPDSTKRTVQALYAGEEDMFKITPKFSEPYVVNKSHTLSLYCWKKISFKPYTPEIQYLEITVADYLSKGKEWQRTSYQWRNKDGTSFKKRNKPLPIDPWILGSWLGDGSSNIVSITTMDAAIRDAWYSYLQGYSCRITQQEGNKASTYNFKHATVKGSGMLQDLIGLEVRNNKHIPKMYKLASRADRLQLLAGLLDTDGHKEPGNGYEIVQVRKQLADDIRELAQSLGFQSAMSVKVINGVNYYRQHIYGDKLHEIPLKLEYKRINPEYEQQREHWREPFTIEPVGVGKFHGFQVDKDNLLLLADYTVQRNSGKTACAANEAIWAVNGYNPITKKHSPVPAKVVVVLDSPDKVQDVWIPELRKWAVIPEESLHKRGRPHVTEITFSNGSSLRFLFALAEAMSFESLETDYVLIDEPVPKAIWVALLRSGRKKNRKAKFLLIGTPIQQSWVREYYVEWQKGNFPDTEFFKMSTSVNADNLSDGYIEEYSRHLTEAEKRTRLHGDFFNNEGMALAGLFKRERHVLPASELPDGYQQAWPHVIALDPHPNKPTYGCMLTVSPEGRRYYVGEFAKKVVARDLAHWLKDNWLAYHRVIDIVSDSSGKADYTGGEGFKSFVEVLNECGVRVRGTSYTEKSEDDFLTRIQEALYIPDGGEPSLQFLIQCTGIVRDIENVQWKAQKGTEEYQPKLEIGNKDYLACLKYALAANLTFDNSRRKVIRPANPSPWSGKSTQASGGERVGYMERSWERNRKRDDDDW